MVELNLLTSAQVEALSKEVRRALNTEAKRRSRSANPEREEQVRSKWIKTDAGQASLRAAWGRYYQTEKHRECRKRNHDPFKSLTYTRRFRGPKDAHLVPEVFEIQGSVCAICGSPSPGKRTWHADHDHETGLLRGLLCARCNTGLGLLHDSEVILEAAKQYLKDPPANRITFANEVRTLTPQELQQLRSRRKKGMVNPERMPEFVAFQDAKCAICGTSDPGKNGWGADHDHTTGLLRGALCNTCNAGIGRFADSISLLESAIVYMANPPAEQVRRV